MKNREYWKKRFELLEEAQNSSSEKYVSILKEEYDKALIKIEKDITNWYTRLADNNEISYSNAKKLLDKKELKEFKWTVEEYIEKGKENSINQKWIKELENASTKVHIDKLNSIKVQIQNELEYLYDKENKGIEKLLKQQYEDTYYKSAHEIQKGLNQFKQIQKINTEEIQKIISKPWTTDNQTFSDRIWKHKDDLLNTLQKELTQAMIRGDNIHKIINKVEKDFNISKRKASRLVMTEAAFFSSAGQKDCFNSLNVKQYEIVATLDNRTSEICQDLDGKVFDMKDYEIGATAPPFHCYCRSVTAPYFNDEFTQEEKRAYRDEEGKTIYVDSKIKYKDWYNKYVDKEEGIIEKLSNKNKKIKYEDITKQKTNIINQAFKSNNIKNIALNSDIKSIKIGGNKAYHRNGNIVLKKNYNNHTIRHEIAHAVDYSNKWLSSNKKFVEAIHRDKKTIQNKKDLYRNIIKNNSNYIELSDIISGITNNEIKGRYKHNNKYWKKPHKLEREIFAQLFTAAGNNDLKQLETCQKYLPNIFKEFDNLIRRIL